MNSALATASRGVERTFLLVDLSSTGSVTEDARRVAVTGMRALNPQATAVFGADLHHRVIATLITKAAGLLDVRLKGPVCFFVGEKEARAWLTQVRNGYPKRRFSST